MSNMLIFISRAANRLYNTAYAAITPWLQLVYATSFACCAQLVLIHTHLNLSVIFPSAPFNAIHPFSRSQAVKQAAISAARLTIAHRLPRGAILERARCLQLQSVYVQWLQNTVGLSKNMPLWVRSRIMKAYELKFCQASERASNLPKCSL